MIFKAYQNAPKRLVWYRGANFKAISDLSALRGDTKKHEKITPLSRAHSTSFG